MKTPATATSNAQAAPKRHVLDFRAYRVEKKEKKEKEDAKKVSAQLKKLEKEEKKKEKEREEGEPPRPAPQVLTATQARNKRKRAAEKKKAAEKKAADVETSAPDIFAAAETVALPLRPAVQRYIPPSAYNGRWCNVRKRIVYDN